MVTSPSCRTGTGASTQRSSGVRSTSMVSFTRGSSTTSCASCTTVRTRTFSGALGNLKLSAKPEGGHYTFVEVHTDQMGESRMDRNVKRFFVELHRVEDPSHTMQAAY